MKYINQDAKARAQHMIDSAQNRNIIEFGKHFDASMAQRVIEKIDEKKMEIAEKVYGQWDEESISLKQYANANTVLDQVSETPLTESRRVKTSKPAYVYELSISFEHTNNRKSIDDMISSHYKRTNGRVINTDRGASATKRDMVFVAKDKQDLVSFVKVLKSEKLPGFSSSIKRIFAPQEVIVSVSAEHKPLLEIIEAKYKTTFDFTGFIDKGMSSAGKLDLFLRVNDESDYKTLLRMIEQEKKKYIKANPGFGASSILVHILFWWAMVIPLGLPLSVFAGGLLGEKREDDQNFTMS